MSDSVNSSVRDELIALLRSNELPTAAVSAVEAALASVVGHRGLVTLPTVGRPGQHVPTEKHPLPPPESERYRDVGPVGLGGTSEVRRVRDRHLNRVVAMKTLRAAVESGSDRMTAFVEEAKASAQLQHPNIVPVYDMGVHSDGRPWFTMREVVGRTLTEVIREVHAASNGHRGIGETGWTLSRLVSAFQTVCDAVAYAHERGVMHRDLKPHNIMLGPLGEVYVLDWGLSKLLRHGTVQQTHDADGRRIVGTPAFMAPEQARGDEAGVNALSDVYGLGAVLYAILANRPPYLGIRSLSVVNQVAAGPPEPLVSAASLPLPPELVAVCERAMARQPADRFDSALAVAQAVRAWQDDTRKREQARQLVARSLALVDEADASLREAERLRSAADALLVQVKPWQPESDKIPGWDLLDAANEAERRAALQRYQVDQGLYAALRIDRDLAEAHAALAERYLVKHAVAEAARDSKVMLRAEVSLNEHRDALAASHPTHQKLTTYLRGDGVLSLTTNPPGARVLLYRQTLRNRRLVDVFERDLGATPLVKVPLAMGSYVCELQMPGHDTVRYPVEVPRLGEWDCVAPGHTAPTPIWLPPAGRFSADEIYIPAGWFRSGGDADTYRSHPARRLWCDALVMQRFAVTNREYIAFLDALVASGREDEALEHAPRERSSAEGGLGSLMYGRTDAGGFVIQPDADGDVAHPNEPVFHLDWHGAQAYMAWWAECTGQPWRLPGELEWEKAARGVDGRFYPWGDVLDPSWCSMHDSRQGRPMPAQVDTYPVDVSVYGVRGLGGNIRDWCADLEGQVDGERVSAPDPVVSAEDPRRTVRGGSWFDAPRNARCANRDRNVTGFRVPLNGFRGLYRPTDD